MSEKKMISIWFFVGLMLLIIGVIITAMGIYYLVHPETHTAMAHLNPSLWWGVIILVAGTLFLVFSIIDYRRA
ncbi:hypothetical protein JXO59_05110 [candidate division KSB1 bacterium]|nr:hypothetical protein [candidate division KSB1 bacterium]